MLELLPRVHITHPNTEPRRVCPTYRNTAMEIRKTGRRRARQLFKKEATESSAWTPEHRDACRDFHGLSNHQCHSQRDLVSLTQAAINENIYTDS